MPKASVLIAGCGDVGSRLATQLLANDWQGRRTIELSIEDAALA